MSYTTKTKIENFLMVDIDAAFDSQINDWISAAEEYINNYTGRTFGHSATTKYFDGSGNTELIIDSFTGSLTVNILESNSDDTEYTLTEGQDNDYITYPYNETSKYKLIMTTNSQIGYWPKGKGRIKLTGNFGVGSTVPKSIEFVATKLVSKIIEKGLKGGQISSESLGDYSVTFDNTVDESKMGLEIRRVLDQYKIITL